MIGRVVTLVLVLAGCRNFQPDTSTPCGKIEAALQTCASPMSDGDLRALDDHCVMYANPGTPEYDTTSLAAIARQSIRTCARETTCEGVSKCLNDHHCSTVIDIKTGENFGFQCR
jgi:hypothetical protein